jgi:endonuclease YncB( thermonuclease family)
MTLIAVLALLALFAVAWRLERSVARAALLTLALGASPWCAGACDYRADEPAAHTGWVARVSDGDTLTVLSGRGRERVRLLGIDAPEATSTRLGRPDCGGAAATASLRRLVRPGGRVRLATDPDSGDVRDRYGRLLAYASSRAGRDLGEPQLAAGMAMV